MRPVEKMLEVRKKIKSKKPEFVMQDFHKRKELKRRWRRPRGMHSKLRMRKAGHPKHVEIGYGSPAEAKHLDSKGRRRIMITTIPELLKVNPKTEAAVVRHGTGLKRKLELSAVAQEKGITIINARMEKLEKKLQERKAGQENRKKKLDEKNKKESASKEKPAKETKETKQAPEAKETPQKTEEELKQEEKQEHDRLLTKRDP